MKFRSGRSFRALTLAMLAVTATVLTGCTGSADAGTNGKTDAGTPFTNEISTRLDTALADAMTLSGSSGAIAGVWAPWAGQWVASPGTTTRDGEEPLSPDMRFRIAANTKSMTCTVLLKLVEENKVALSDPVTKYVKRVSGVDGVTLGQLCQSTSGIGDYKSVLKPYFVNIPTRQWPPLEVLSEGLAMKRTGEPGGSWADSDTGFVLLGMALQVASGQDWAELYQHYIFDPLGMDKTSLPAADQLEIPGAHPHGYAAALYPSALPNCESIRDVTRLSPSMSWVAGGVVSTITDMRDWSRALAEGRLVSEKSADAQWATVPIGGKAPSWQTYGLGAQQFGPLRGNAGAVPGFLSAVLTDPGSGLTVVVMLNNSTSGSGFVQTLAQQLASIASKAPAVTGQKAPMLELPWSEEQAVQEMHAAAACPPPPPPAEPEPPAEPAG